MVVTALKDGGYTVSDSWYSGEDVFLCACSTLQEAYDILDRKFSELNQVLADNDAS